jgi:cytochrome b subunit of formate dehydrogenase
MIETTHPEPGAQPGSSAFFSGENPGKAAQSWLLLGSTFIFALLQSICTAVVAISGLRLVIGFSSFASALGARVPIALHVDWIRIPMLLLALAGSIVNLYVVWRVRRLRARPSAQWRRQPLSAAKRRSESLQIALASTTLVLVAVEEITHIVLHRVP